MEFKTRAIVLKALDFREHQKIVTLYSEECGVISMMMRRLSAKNLQKQALCTPLTKALYVLKKGRGDLFSFVDGNTLDVHTELRSSFDRLKIALEFLKQIEATQWPGKKEAPLYQLLSAYLKELTQTSYPHALWASFLLKLHKYEGVLQEELINDHLLPLCHIVDFDELREEIALKEVEELMPILHV